MVLVRSNSLPRLEACLVRVPVSETQPDPEQENFDEACAIPAEIRNLKWLRIDFDPPTARGILHHECHLHLGNFLMLISDN